ncbi:MAG: MFS transporter [Muribaculaceae bacterium]|nr:MFS transporter [Muribaculaceae bacterium]
MKNLKLRLIVMNFLEFAVWGAYLTCMGNYLGKAGMGNEIAWFYAIQGIVSIFMPTLMGIVADKYIQPQRLLGICHAIAGAAMVALALMGMNAADAGVLPNKTAFIAIYSLSVAFYMPTLALSNTVAFTILKDNGMDTEKDFPPIRVFGTIGFIATMWFVNCAYLENGKFGFTLGDSDFKFQYTYMQFLVSGLLSFVLFLYCFSLPACKLVKKEAKSLVESLGLNAFKLMKTKKMALFFIFSALLGMSLQVTNGFATPYLTHFKSDPAMADTFGANNATMLVSLSQIAEALCILLIPFFLKRYGIKVVMLIAMFAWVLRFGFFGAGNPAFPGVILIVLSCLVYGVAFDFFNVSGGIFVDKECDPDIKASAQGLFMLMTNGLGATIGTLAAGAIVNSLCHWIDGGKYLVGNTPTSWSTAWYIFAAFALVVAVSFMFLFKYKHVREEKK